MTVVVGQIHRGRLMALVSAPGLWVPQVGASRLEGLTPQKKGHTRVPYAETPVPPEGGGGTVKCP